MNMAVDGRRRRDDLICEAVAWQMPQGTPMRRTRSACCARAASGHAAVLPRSVMNSRRPS
jgi:hypothetical protein